MSIGSNPVRRAAALLLTIALAVPPVPAQQQQQPEFTFKVQADLVLVNVVARDKSGTLVRDLARDDFTIVEDSKPQSITSFDVENTDLAFVAPSQEVTVSGATPLPDAAHAQQALKKFENRRLIVLFFDLSSMEPEEIERAVDAGTRYLEKQMTTADLVAVASYQSSLVINQDFTSDKDLLTKAINRFSIAQKEQQGGTGDTGDNTFTADDIEFNIFNTDRKLAALESLAKGLAHIQQKKSIVYFSSGVEQTGMENQSQLRSAINAAVRANVAIYSVDIHGLQALPPGGDAQTASVRGVAAYSGQMVRNQFDTQLGNQEGLNAIASDTGGRAFFDTNDFGQVFQRVQQDTSSYYVLGYRSTNPARDGHFRHIQVKSKRAGLKLEFRSGYYAARDFQHMTSEDRDVQLDNELAAEFAATDVRVFLAASYFRMDNDRYYVPVSLIVPGSEIPFTKASDKDKATLDIVGVVREGTTKFPAGSVRETLHLNIDASQQVRRKNVQFDTAFLLPPGSYTIKFVVRENQTGRLGSFETSVTVPDLKKAPVKLSSVVLSAQLKPADKKRRDNPLVRDNMQVVPSVTHVFTPDQKLLLFYEIYDPANDKREKPAPQTATAPGAQPAAPQMVKPAKGAIRVLTSIQFFSGKVKVYETPLVEAVEINSPERRAASFQLQVPLSGLKPGFYTAQVNVIDDAAGSFAFPRVALLVREPAPAPTLPATGSPTGGR